MLIFLSFPLMSQVDMELKEFRAHRRELSMSDISLEKLEGISSKKIAIINNTAHELNFQLSFPENPWSNYKIQGNYVQTYDLISFDRMYIKVKTEEKIVEYYLSGGGRYEIKWNAAKGLWDVYRISLE